MDKNSTGAGFTQSTSVSPANHHSISAQACAIGLNSHTVTTVFLSWGLDLRVSHLTYISIILLLHFAADCQQENDIHS
jgi:ribose/xylose/arabinose/galactoside ABC-type transport system permease subunit